MTQSSTNEITLVGHGWPELDDRENPVFCATERLRNSGWRVRAAFLKQDPVFAGAEGVVVPVFMSDGYFAQKVREIAGDAIVTQPVGVSPLMDAVVDAALAAVEGAVILVGHGTPKHKASRDSVIRQVERLRSSGWDIAMGFIDDDPSLDTTLQSVDGTVAILPYFVAPGPHTLEDIPEMARRARPVLQDVKFLEAVGLSHEIDRVILSLIQDPKPG